MNKMIGYCGLDCEKCDAYIASKNNDNELRAKTAEEWSKLNGVPIAPKHINCQGCKTRGIKTLFCDKMCEIRKCAMKKKLDSCGECESFESCEALKPVLDNNPDALENLKNGG
ncbi:MAG: DUF3795 domain-containing protein [Abditibacteriota bacterium]|nr:DUF3795 domain-containing protein [Abditibacteriota bacterium]